MSADLLRCACLLALGSFSVEQPLLAVMTPCGTTVTPNPDVIVTWDAVVNATDYEVEWTDALPWYTGSFVDQLTETAPLTASTVGNTLTPGATYYWRFRSFVNGFWGGYGQECAFTIGTASPPGTPSLTVPGDNTAGHVPSGVALQWVAGTNSTSHTLQYSTDPGFASPTNVPGLGTTHNFTGVEGTTYYWRVQALNGTTSGPWSASRSFHTWSVLTTLNLKVFLQGPLNTTTLLMNDGLRSSGVLGTVASNHPYDSLGFTGFWTPNPTITTSLATTGNNAIVDWILLELRHGTTNVPLYKHVVLVQRDGDVVMPNGTVPNLRFPMRNCKIGVRHRNHLGIMTLNTVAATGTAITLDLTQTSTPLYGTEPTATVATTRRAMWAGETGNNGQVKYTGTANDRDAILLAIGSTTPNNTTTGYKVQDVTLDGVVKYTGSGNDRDPILLTVGSTTPNNVRTQQLP